MKTVKLIVEILSPLDSSVILVSDQITLRNSDGVTLNGGLKYRRGMKFA